MYLEALNTADIFRTFAKTLPGAPLLASITELGKTPFSIASEFEAMGHKSTHRADLT